MIMEMVIIATYPHFGGFVNWGLSRNKQGRILRVFDVQGWTNAAVPWMAKSCFVLNKASPSGHYWCSLAVANNVAKRGNTGGIVVF
ncbi:MAG: hypothetical protein CVU90_06335 [Firmicutes bacterium HGW-Firmicutes-15]|nr:MAG: hypothetical protein CVU90_06335 [Firmicutes bacterium HGW-Firmicutes-15]